MGNKSGSEPEPTAPGLAGDEANINPLQAPVPIGFGAPLPQATVFPPVVPMTFPPPVQQFAPPFVEEPNPYALTMAVLQKSMSESASSGNKGFGKKEAFNLEKFQNELPSLTLGKLDKLDWVFSRYRTAEDIVKALDIVTRHIATLSSKLDMMKLDPLSLVHSHQVHQWISEVVDASSEYNAQNPSSWNRMCIIGPPNTYPRYGDLQSAWAPRPARGSFEFLEFKFPISLHIVGVDIFETYNPGSIIRVSAHNGSEWVPLWVGQVDQPNLPEISRIFSPPIINNITNFKSNHVRLDLDCTNSRSWSEIDSVRLRGRESLEWEPRFHTRFPQEFRETAYVFLLAMQRLETLPKDCIYEVLRKLSIHYA